MKNTIVKLRGSACRMRGRREELRPGIASEAALPSKLQSVEHISWKI